MASFLSKKDGKSEGGREVSAGDYTSIGIYYRLLLWHLMRKELRMEEGGTWSVGNVDLLGS